MRENFTQAKCHPDRKHAGRGMCYECYEGKYPSAKRASCHQDRIAWAKGLCKSCYNRKLQEENPVYAESQRANHKKWVARNHDKILADARKYSSLPRVRIMASIRDRQSRLLSFGMTFEDEQRIMDDQGGVCAICGGESGRRPFFDIDHEHDSGLFRGFLCHRCNKGLGLLGDDTKSIKKALEYLLRFDAKKQGTLVDDRPKKKDSACPD